MMSGQQGDSHVLAWGHSGWQEALLCASPRGLKLHTGCTYAHRHTYTRMQTCTQHTDCGCKYSTKDYTCCLLQCAPTSVATWHPGCCRRLLHAPKAVAAAWQTQQRFPFFTYQPLYPASPCTLPHHPSVSKSACKSGNLLLRGVLASGQVGITQSSREARGLGEARGQHNRYRSQLRHHGAHVHAFVLTTSWTQYNANPNALCCLVSTACCCCLLQQHACAMQHTHRRKLLCNITPATWTT